MRNSQKSGYGSTQNSLNELEKSHESVKADDIINQTCCKCSYIIEPLLLIHSLAACIIGAAYGQFIYARIFNRIINDETTNMINVNNESKIINSTKFQLEDSILSIPLFTSSSYPSSLSNSFTIFQSFTDNNTTNLCNTVTNSSIAPSDLDYLRVKAQQKTANLLFICSLCGGIPCIIATNILGANCNKLGRKFLILLTSICTTFRVFVYFILSVYPSLPDYLFYICSLLDGLVGSGGTYSLALYCYITDITSDNDRSYRLTFINYIGSLANLLISLACGYIIKYFGFIYLFLSSFLLYLFACFYIIFFIPETLAELKTKTFLQRIKSCSLKHIKNSFLVFLRKNHPIRKNEAKRRSDEASRPLLSDNDANKKSDDIRQRLVMILVVTANLIYNGGAGGIGAIFTLYLLNTPFCWDSIHLSVYSVYATIVGFSTALIVSKFIKINDILICIASSISYFASLFVYAFASQTRDIYIGIYNFEFKKKNKIFKFN